MIALVKQLSARRCFVLAKLERRANGKVDKIPVSVEGYEVSALDPAHWHTGEEVEHYAALLGYGIGVVLGEASGLACIDLDHSFDPDAGAWKPYVAEVMAQFPGCYFEVSQSNTAAHLFFSVTPLAEHGTRIRDIQAEVYTRNRFIYLTGTSSQGDATIDHTLALIEFINTRGAWKIDEAPEDWLDGPRPGYTPITSDADLLARAGKKTAKQAFGGKISFAEIWNGDANALAQAYPAQGAGEWDYSSADLALASHLAFWTSGDHERVARLMRMSSLVRDKWNRADYFRGTIMKAVAGCAEPYNAKPIAGAALPPTAPSGPSPAPAPSDTTAAPATPPVPVKIETGVGMLSDTEQAEMFKGWVYIESLRRVQLEDGRSLDKDRLDDVYGGRQYVTAEQKTTNSTWDAFVRSTWRSYEKVHSQCFEPALPLGFIRERFGRREVNKYREIFTPQVEGDASPFVTFVRTLLPEGNDADILLFYMAACLQFPGIKFKWAPYVQGAKGNGKSTLGTIMKFCVGSIYTHTPKSEELGEKFNSVLVDKLLVILDEIHSSDKRDLEHTLKPLVTQTEIEVRPMYAEKMMSGICFNLMLFSNYKTGVRIDANERRYAPLFCAQQSAEDIEAQFGPDYFLKLYAWLEGDGYSITNHYLRHLAIPDELNPATHCIRAPVTTSSVEAARKSLGPIEQELLGAIEEGRPGFKGGWGSSVELDIMLALGGKSKAIPKMMREDMWRAVGYVPHPALKGPIAVALDGRLHSLYIRKGHEWDIAHATEAQVREAYTYAQR